MRYDFDKVIERKNTDSLKYDFAVRKNIPEDALPMWVADMDFSAPKEVLVALEKRIRHGIFGYSEGREDYFEAVRNWYERYFDWQIKRPWMVKTPGVVYAVAMAVKAFTNKNDRIMIQEPVYYPFKEIIESNERKIVVNPLVYQQGKYVMDYEGLEKQIIENEVKLFILCSPHNPVGRVWSVEELIRLGEICIRQDVLVVADEIHQDFIYPGHEHHVFAGLRESFAERTITCTSPSKTFNLAGLQLSNVFISNQKRRRQFRKEVEKSGYSQPNLMGLVSCQAAYSYGHDWLEQLKQYLLSNLLYMKSFLSDKIPDAKLIEPEGTYLVWVDLSNISIFKGKNQKEVEYFMTHNAKLWLDSGTMFGQGGEGFWRFNIACPRKVLEKALTQLQQALEAS